MRSVHVSRFCLALTALAVCLAPAHAEGADPFQPYVCDWATRAFTGAPAPEAPPHVDLEVLQQDHSVLSFGESCIGTPLRIGTQSFERGLGTHANSVIAVTVPEGAARFEAQAGIDNNADTRGTNGSAIFSVEADGKSLFKSEVLRGGAMPAAVSVAIPANTPKITLRVDATDDGVGHDQADWADARFVMADGAERRLDENQNNLLFHKTEPPFSFVIDGKPSAEWLATAQKSVKTVDEPQARFLTVSWHDAATGLRLTAEVKIFRNFPAVDWLLWFENTGAQDTPIIEDIQALDLSTRTGYLHTPAVMHTLEGDACGETSFLPKDITLETGKSFRMAPTGGRSSSISAFPFFNFEYAGNGLITAIGWTGQWAAQLDRDPAGPTRIRAGMELTHLRLNPGERIRTPRIALLAWQHDRTAAHNTFRRLLLTHYVPQADGKPTPLPFVLQTFDRYNGDPAWTCEAGQLAAVDAAHDLGCDTYWLDAAWFPRHFPTGVGSWFCEPKEFPNGLKPVGDRCDQYGMKFVLWFEPERVNADTQISNEYPQFVFGGKNGGLFKLNDPEARRFLTDLLSKRISEYGIDIYRNDFNIDPLPFWRDNDAPDRQGMTEIQYITGLYEMWDELIARHPGLLIDDCASGGRRIDIEMCSRSVPFWRSDTNCFAGHSEWKQAQTMGLCQYVPLNMACAWNVNATDMRSATTAGLITQLTYREPGFPFDEAKRLIAEAKENAPYFYGDLYPITACSNATDQFAAFQFHRPDLDAGIVFAFRRPDCPLAGIIAGVQGLVPEHTYAVTWIDDAGTRTEQNVSGKDLAAELLLRIPERGASLVVRYRAVN